MTKNLYILGIDEVGRGPIAGPVCVCSFLIEKENEEYIKKELTGITDSKKLTEKKRYFYFEKIKKLKSEKKIFSSAIFVNSKQIDKIGIVKSIKKATEKSFLNTIDQKNKDRDKIIKNLKVLLDGGLFLNNSKINQESIIKGDQKEFVISCASVVAKCIRDDYMKKISLKYPEYFFEKNKGYGTKIHLIQIEKKGVSDEHRKTFLKKYI